MQPTEPIPRTVDVTRPAGLAYTMGRWEASRLRHPYVGPEHLLLGLLRQGDNPAARCWSPTAWTWRPSAPRSSG